MTTKKKRNHWTWAIPASTLILGIAIGAAAGGGSTASPADPTEPEVITETVTEEVEVIKVPEACISALDDGDVLVDMHFDTIGMLMTLFEEIPDAMLAAYYGTRWVFSA